MRRINKNVNTASLFVQLAVTSIQQIIGVQVIMDSLQHEAHDKIYEIDTFYDHLIVTFTFLGDSQAFLLMPLATRFIAVWHSHIGNWVLSSSAF